MTSYRRSIPLEMPIHFRVWPSAVTRSLAIRFLRSGIAELFVIIAGLAWATFLVMRRTFASLSKTIGIDAHTRSAQMGNTVDVNENEYAVSSFAERLAAVRKLESAVDQLERR